MECSDVCSRVFSRYRLYMVAEFHSRDVRTVLTCTADRWLSRQIIHQSPIQFEQNNPSQPAEIRHHIHYHKREESYPGSHIF